MLNVFLIVPTLSGGGAERFMLTLARHLDRTKFNITLGVVDGSSKPDSAEFPRDIEYIDFKCARVRNGLPKIISYIRAQKPDLVFSTLGHLNLALAMFHFLMPSRTKLIGRMTIVLSKNINEYSFSKLWLMGYRYFLPMLDKIVCQSQDMYNDLRENFAIEADKMKVINNPVDIGWVRKQAAEKLSEKEKQLFDDLSSFTLIASGRLAYQKGFDMLIEAIDKCRNLPVQLFIFGEGEEKRNLQNQIDRLNLKESVQLMGFKANPFKYYKYAHAFILSSRYEGFPNVVLEALACDLAVISTPAPGGINEILCDQPGCTIAQSISSSSIAQAIRKQYERKEDGFPGNPVKVYSIDSILGQYEDLFEKIALS